MKKSILIYCANANFLLTKTGLPALFQCRRDSDKGFPGLDISLKFREICMVVTVKGDKATLVIKPIEQHSQFFRPQLIDNLAFALAENTDVADDCVGEVHSDKVIIHNATANVAAIFAVSLMISATRFNEVRHHGQIKFGE